MKEDTIGNVAQSCVFRYRDDSYKMNGTGQEQRKGFLKTPTDRLNAEVQDLVPNFELVIIFACTAVSERCRATGTEGLHPV